MKPEKKITVVFSSHLNDRENDNFIHSIKQSCGVPYVEILCYKNMNEYSLSEVYNRGLKESVNNIVVFTHNDIIFETKNWGKKLIKYFEKYEDYGILGLAGTKYLSKTGRWWDKPATMYGIVNHKQGDKKWTSKYSNDRPGYIDDVVVVDGLFFAVNKEKIKHTFDESFKGFHFYDLAFCFPNYLDNVKIGVVTDLRVTHLSIGQTNQQWEDNRLQFAEKYKDKLEITIPKDYTTHPMKVLLTCLSFCNYTGSEIYIYELSKELVNLGCDVTVYSNTKGGGDLHLKAIKNGVKVIDFTNQINLNFDVIHCNHKPVTEHFLKINHNVPIVTTIHSEVISLEEPINDNRIKKYITIRPEITDYITTKFNIDINKTELIYNPFDFNRFNSKTVVNKNNEKKVLFVGTLDYLRKNAIYDLIDKSVKENFQLTILGKYQDNYLPDVLPDNVKFINHTWGVEKYLKEHTHTAGILLGRTTIEGWLCGLPAIIYNVDDKGNILSIEEKEVPNDLERFDSKNVAKQIFEIYKGVI